MSVERVSAKVVFACRPSSMEQHVAVSDEVAALFCAKFGGCSVSWENGYWSPDGDQFKQSYSAPIKESALTVSVLVMPEQKGVVTELIRNASALIKSLTSSDGMRYVHCEYTAALAAHVDIQAPVH